MSTTCPHCGSLLRSEEEHQGRCRSCLRRLPWGIQAEPPRPATPPAGGDERPDLLLRRRRRAGRPGGEGWGVVRAGLACLAAAALVSLLTVLGATFATFAARQAPSVVVLLALFQLLGGLLGLVGLCFCCTSPEAAGLRPLAGGALACLVLAGGVAAVFVVIDAFLKFPNPAGLATLGLGGSSLLLALAGGVLFFLFLRGVARHFGSRHLASECVVCGLAAGFFALMGAATAGWAQLDFAPLDGHALVPLALFACGGFGFSLIFLLWLFSLFVRMHDLIPPAGLWREPEEALETPHEHGNLS
jgi:hypothetical protein